MNLSGIQPPKKQTDVFFHEFASFCLAAMISEVFRRPDPTSSHNPVKEHIAAALLKLAAPLLGGAELQLPSLQTLKRERWGKIPVRERNLGTT